MSTREIIYAAAGASGPATYIEDVFSTYLYTGTGNTQTITNNIDLSDKGGMVWIKSRSNSSNHLLFNTVEGATKLLRSNTTDATITDANSLTSFNSNGFSLGVGDGAGNNINTNTATYASWTFAKQPKFFDIVTYTGDGQTDRQINHNLGSEPGMIIVKCTSNSGAWGVYHRSLDISFPYQRNLFLNNTAAQANNELFYQSSSQTSTFFTLGRSNLSIVNGAGQTYVAYLFAHDAGGFGASGADNVISCGSFTTDSVGTGSVVNLGYEPQFILFKAYNAVADWRIVDGMRGMTVGGQNDAFLRPNSTLAETSSNEVAITSTGFSVNGVANGNYIYMAIRRGPMKTPTSGTSVFAPVRETSSANPQTLTTGFPVDLTINTVRVGGATRSALDRLRGGTTNFYNYLSTQSTSAESQGTGVGIAFDNNTGVVDSGFWNSSDAIFWNFRRAPGFFDIVCYTGTAYPQPLVNHNLGVAPELMIVKRRNGTSGWAVYSKLSGSSDYVYWSSTGLNGSTAATGNIGASPYITSTTIDFDAIAVSPFTGTAGATIVTYLFATVAGVSKVGSYTGTGLTQTINAGLPTGARFVLIKRTDSTGDWWVWDTARGMVASTDPRLALNSTAAEINNDWVYTVTNGFQIVTSDATVNASGGTYIYLAIA